MNGTAPFREKENKLWLPTFSFLFSPFTKQQNFSTDQIESICRQQIEFPSMMIYVFDREENIVERYENAGCQHFLLYQQCFQKPCFVQSQKPEIVWESV